MYSHAHSSASNAIQPSESDEYTDNVGAPPVQSTQCTRVESWVILCHACRVGQPIEAQASPLITLLQAATPMHSRCGQRATPSAHPPPVLQANQSGRVLMSASTTRVNGAAVPLRLDWQPWPFTSHSPLKCKFLLPTATYTVDDTLRCLHSTDQCNQLTQSIHLLPGFRGPAEQVGCRSLLYNITPYGGAGGK